MKISVDRNFYYTIAIMPIIDRKETLAALGIRDYETDIRTMNGPELLRHFGAASSGRLVTSRLVRNLVHQAWRRIRAGDEPPVRGNVRSFWYRFVKPAVLRVPARDRTCMEPDEATNMVLADLVEQRRLYDYEDFGFADDNWRNRSIGLARPHVLLFAEKTAHTRLLARAQHRLGVSFVSLGGTPSACTSEYTAKQLRAALPDGDDEAPTVHMIGLVDHDPAGAMIAAAFADQLTSFGLRPASMTLPFTPACFSDKELAIARLPLRPGKRTDAWLKDGVGVGRQAWGLSVESLPDQRIEALLDQSVLAVAPEARPVALPPGRSLTDFDPRTTIVVRPNDVGPSVLAAVDKGQTVVVVHAGRVRAVIGR